MVSKIFYFHPYLGKSSNFTDIFQIRQLVVVFSCYFVLLPAKKPLLLDTLYTLVREFKAQNTDSQHFFSPRNASKTFQCPRRKKTQHDCNMGNRMNFSALQTVSTIFLRYTQPRGIMTPRLPEIRLYKGLVNRWFPLIIPD